MEETVVQKESFLSKFARKRKVSPIGDEQKNNQNDNLIYTSTADDQNNSQLKLTLKKRTFLISSIQPTIKAKDIFMKALKRKKELDNEEKQKSKNVIKMSIVYIEKFIRLMRQQSSLIRFKETRLSQLEIINDKSVESQYFLVNKLLTKEKPSLLLLTYEYLQKMQIYIWMKSHIVSRLKLDQVDYLFLPNSQLYMMWSIFLMIVLTLNVVYIPLAISFQDIQLSTFASILINILPNVSFMVEIIIKFNTAIYKKGLIIKSRKQIVLSYLQKRFWYDLCIVFCFFFGSYFQNAFIQIVLLLRFFDITRLIAEIEERYNLKERLYGINDMVKLILLILYIAHLCGCIWHYIAVIEIENGFSQTWMNKSGISLSDSWWYRYVDSLYWAVVTMCTLGYGDIVPITSNEKVFTIWVTLISCFVFGYSINQIGEILQEFLRIEEEFKIKMSKLNMYMQKRELNDDVCVKVRKYFEYLHKENLQSNNEGATVIDSLESDLKQEVLRDIYGKLLNSKKLFSLNFSIDKLAVKIKEKKVGLHEYIYKEGEEAEEVYFLVKGQAEVIKTQTKTVLQSIQKGMMFGEIEFFTGQQRQFSLRASTVCQLAYLNKQEFLDTIKGNNVEFERFNKMKDLLSIYKDTQGFDHQCGSCGKYTHLIVECPQINICINKYKTLSKYNFYVCQVRDNKFKRNRAKYIGTFQKTALVQQQAKIFYENEKLQFLDIYDGDEDDAILNQNNQLNRSPYGDKRKSWNQVMEQNVRKKSQVRLDASQNQEELGIREKKKTIIGYQKIPRSSFSKKDQVKKLSRIENIQQDRHDQMKQDELPNNQMKADNNFLKVINEKFYKQTDETENNKNEIPQVRKSMKQQEQEFNKLIQLEKEKQTNVVQDEKNDLIGVDKQIVNEQESLFQIKKRGLMPSFFDSKKFSQPKKNEFQSFQSSNQNSPQLEFQKIENKQNINGSEQRLRNKSSLTLSQDTSSDEFSSEEQADIQNNEAKNFNKKKQSKKSSKNEIKSKKSSKSKNSQHTINRQSDNYNPNQIQKALMLIGKSSQDDQKLLNQQESVQQKYLNSLTIAQQLIVNGSFQQIDETYLQNQINSQNNSINSQSSKKLSTKIFSMSQERKSQIKPDTLDPQQINHPSHSSKDIISKKKSINQISQQILSNFDTENLPNQITPSIIVQPPISERITTQVSSQKQKTSQENIFKKLSIQQIKKQSKSSIKDKSLTQLFEDTKNDNNSNIADQQSLTQHNITNNQKLFQNVITQAKAVQDVRRKVSILVKKNGPQDTPINVTLSVNQQEQEQLREILEIEQNMAKGSRLKKTMARKLNSKLRSRSNELLEILDNKKFTKKPTGNNKITQNQDQENHSQGYIFDIPSLNNLDSTYYQFQMNKRISNSQLSQHQIKYNSDEDNQEEVQFVNFIDELELRKFEQIFLKKYDDEFASCFEKGKQYQEYFPKNNISNVLEMISIRRKLNPFYRVLLLRKKAQSSKKRPLNRKNNRKSKLNINLINKSMYGTSFLKQSYSVNSQAHSQVSK
ncbi:cyclic nucleotide-binding domain protein (macronuclear) [Tetrahymena thermophila SB210]|uniref:Cyclic nucleotide-binding domain protein n=1 Tax=Tetrahymena thermophila (strain SB210) TaxID=312017 RepID=W7XKP9_TETTS|nr:cyclic nucleotide-binding domain protein [Tetrahymena thermophila SB210]EWS75104.1 cyclic nucleotide-binding domain protein [Tetrahymena thermophila SB210]|eukprot:XP_012652342.1 cyclic nucleotide-binding domain protein [Tetrahymena thermophila SB210]